MSVENKDSYSDSIVLANSCINGAVDPFGKLDNESAITAYKQTISALRATVIDVCGLPSNFASLGIATFLEEAFHRCESPKVAYFLCVILDDFSEIIEYESNPEDMNPKLAIYIAQNLLEIVKIISCG